MKPRENHQPKRVLHYPFSPRKLLAGIMLAAMLLTLIPATLFARAEGGGAALDGLTDGLVEEHWYVGPNGQVPLDEVTEITVPVDGTMPQFSLGYYFDISQDRIAGGAIARGKTYEIALPDGFTWVAGAGSTLAFRVTEVELPEPELPPNNTTAPAPTEALPVAPTEALPVAPTEALPVAPTEALPVAPTEELPVAPTEEPPVAPTEALPVAPTEEPPKTPTEEPTKDPTVEPPPANSTISEILYHIAPMLLPLSEEPPTTQIGTVTLQDGKAILTFDYPDAVFAGDTDEAHETNIQSYLDSIADGIKSCEIQLTAELDKGALGDAKDQQVTLSLFGQSIVFTQEMPKPVEAPTMEKKAAWNQDKSAITWTITITPKGGAAAEDCVLTDTMTNQTYVADSFQVNGAAAAPVLEGDSKFAYTFPGALGDHMKDGKIVITYDSVPLAAYMSSQMGNPAETALSFPNDAVLTAGFTGPHFEPVAVSHTLTDKKPTFLFKNARVGSTSDRIKWTIKIDNGGYTLNHVVLTDLLGPGITLEADTLLVGGKTPTEGSWSYAPPVESSGSTLTMDLGTLSRWIEITYETSITDPQIAKGATAADNRASITFGGGGTGGEGSWGHEVTVDKTFQIQEGSLQKKGTLLPNENQIEWVITVNPGRVPMTGAELYEELDWNQSTGMQRQHFLLDTFQLSIEGAEPITAQVSDGNLQFVVGDNTYTSRWRQNWKDHGAFYLDLGDLAEGKSLTLTFRTEIIDSLTEDYTYNSDSQLVIANGAQLKTDKSSSIPNAFATVRIKGNVLTKAYGKDYNPSTGEMTWNLTVNANKIKMPDAKIVDTLPKGMTYVDGTAYYVVNNDGKQVPVQASIGDQVTFDLGAAADGKTVVLTFKTKLDVNEVCWTTDSSGNKTLLAKTPDLTNTAYLERTGYPKVEKATGTAVFPGIEIKTMTKTGVANIEADCSIQYSVIINPSRLALEEQYTGVKWNYVEDRMGYGLQLDVDSVTLERGTSGGENDFTPAGGALDSGEFEVEYTPEYRSSLLKVTLPKEDPSTTCYRLSYKADIVLKEGSYALTNSVSLNGMKSVVVKNEQNVVVTAGAASGLLSRMTVLNLRKVDADSGKGLSGAQFAVYAADTGRLLGMGDSDENGNLQIKVRPNAGGYVIKETAAPTGYAVAEAWANGVTIVGGDKGEYNWSGQSNTLPEGDSIDGNVLVVRNAASTGVIRLVKTDLLGKPLQGAVFGLLPTSMEFGPVAGDSLKQSTSGGDGLVVFENLKAGTYHIKELSAPPNCEPIEDEILVTVDVNGVPSALTWKETGTELGRQSDGLQIVENQVILGTVTVKKVAAGDQEQKGLPGAEFALLDADGVTVASLIVDENGVAVVSGLKLGTYTLHETKAPGGYVVGADQILVLDGEKTEVSLVVENAKQEVTPPPPAPSTAPSPEVPTPTPEATPTPTVLPGGDDNDNDDDDRPAPTPTPPVQPLPDGGVQGDIGPDDPDYFIDDNEIPRGKGEIPDPVYWIDDNGIPLGYQSEDGEWVELDEGEIPLGAMTPIGWVTFAPQTGDDTPTWIVAFALLSAVAAGMTGFAVYQGVKRTRKSREGGPEGRA